MNVTFYNFSKRRNSTKLPGGGTSYACILKDDTSTSRPQIALKWQGGGSPAAFNYAYIPDFHRYYWVNGWTFSDRQWVADLTVDVLASYKAQIGASEKYVLRSASDYDLEVVDTLYTPKIVGSPSITSVSAFTNWADNLSGGTIILGLIGMNDSVAYSANGASYYACSPANYMKLLSDMYTESLTNVNNENYGSSFGDGFKAFSRNIIRSVTNPMQYIKSALWFPFTFTTGAAVNPVLGGITSTALIYPLSNPLKTETATFIAGGRPVNPHDGVWKYIEPFRHIVLHLPPFGTFPIDARKLGTGNVEVKIVTDAISGQAHAYIRGTSTNPLTPDLKPVFANTICQLGVQIDYSGVKSGTSTSISSAISAGAAALSGEALGAAAGVANMLESAVPAVETRSSYGGISGDIAEKMLEVYMYPPVDEDIEDMGRPLCQIKTISTLSGFVMCDNGDVDCAATEDEHRQIEAFLTGGFFYE